MSDGPWQSLPLGPQWKRVAKRVETDAYTLAERREALEAALAQEAEGLPPEAILRMVPIREPIAGVPSGDRGATVACARRAC